MNIRLKLDQKIHIEFSSDINATEKLVKASRFLNIKLLDHLIISETEFYPGRCPGRR